MKKILLLATALFLHSFCFSQFNVETPCATDAILQNHLQADPDFQLIIDQNELLIDYYISNSNSLSNHEIVIPIVVHVIHPTIDAVGSGANISYAQILSQIAALNKAFANNYASPQTTGPNAVNTDIKFCLATVTSPASVTWPGGVTEPGVLRYPHASFSDHNFNVAGANDLLSLTHPTTAHFPFERYLNIWVVRSIDGMNPGTQGYAPNPLMAPPYGNGFPLDGVVLRADVFGDNINNTSPYNLQPNVNSPHIRNEGKVLVHEVGHYLNLWHTFQGGCTGNGDYVIDTPPCTQASSGCPVSPVVSCSVTTQVENFMYYAYDPCWNTFTAGQASRMQVFIGLNRSVLVSSQNLAYTGVAQTGGCIPPILLADIEYSPTQPCINSTVSFTTPTGPGYAATSWSWTFAGGTPGTSTVSNPTVTFATSGNHLVTLTATDANGNTEFEQVTVFVNTCNAIVSTEGNWYFGQYAGLDFSTGVPVEDRSAFDASPKTINSAEAAVTMSNATGNLQFYSDGISVWNYDHELIQTGLNGGNSASQSLAVPFPGNPNKYYLFQMPNYGQFNFAYSIIDMTLSCTTCPSGGNGQVTSVNTSIPVPGNVRVAEGITAVPHCNGIDFWIIVHGIATDNNFYVYLLSNSGLSTALTYPSTFGGNYSEFKASPNGRKIAIASEVSAPSGIGIFDFNNSTGVINNPIILTIADGTQGVSFSPNSDLLYFTHYIFLAGITSLFQYDLTNNIQTTLFTSSTGTTNSLRQLQLGPDNKLYIAKFNSSDLAVINLPDIVGAGCSFNFNGPVLDQLNISPFIRSRFGLPNMIDAKPTPATPSFSYNFTSCSTVQFTVASCYSSLNQSWDFGDATSSTTNNPSHTYSTSGTYIVSLTLSSGSVTLPPITQTITVQTSQTLTISGPAQNCLGTPAFYSLASVAPGYIYTWTIIPTSAGTFSGPNIGANVSVNWTGSGTIEVSNGCATSSQTVTINPLPVVSVTPSSQSICAGTTVQLQATGGGNYSWAPAAGLNNPNIASPVATPAVTTTYTVTVTNQWGCSSTGQVTITVNPLPVIPVITGFANACSGLTIYTLSNCDPALTYTWNVFGGTLQSQSSCSADIQWTSNGGAISVTATSIYGCSTTGAFFTVAPCCVVPGATILLNNTDVVSYFAGNPQQFVNPADIIVINGDFIVNGNLLVDMQQVYLGPDAKIIIDPGFTLTITRVSMLEAGCNKMWDGIYIEDNTASLIIDGQSTLKDAKNAVVAKAGGSFLISEAILDRNFKHVVVKPYPGNHSGSIFNSQLICPGGNSLIFPHVGKRTRIGIEVSNVNNITIGDANMAINSFDNMDFGITALESNITIKNNSFENITTPSIVKGGPCPVGTAICITGDVSNSVNYNATVGGIGTGEQNSIQNGGTGIVLHRNMNGNIINNTINNLSSIGIYVERCEFNKVISIDANIINDARVGIYAYRNPFAFITISFNAINLQNKPYGYGIIAYEVVPFQQTGWYIINRNDIKNARKGIETANLFYPQVEFNKIKIAPPAFNTYADGINMANAYQPVITSNTVNSTSTDWRINGIRVDMSDQSYIFCNSISTVGQALFCGGAMSFATIKNNSFFNSRVGFFLNWGLVGPQGVVGAPSDNRWFGNFPDGHTYSYFSNGTNSPFYVRNQTGIFHPAIMVNDFNTGGMSFPIPINPTNFKQTFSCPKSSVTIDPGPRKPTALKIVRDSVDFPAYIPENKWISKMGVYKLLQEDTSLVSQEQELLLFKDSASLSNMGTLDNIRKKIGNPIMMDQPAIVQQTKADNDALVAANPVESYQKEVNDIFLVERLSGIDSLTQQQINDLRVIANKCPYFDGVSVYMARVLLAVVDSIGTDYLNICEYEGLFPENRSLSFNNEENTEGENSKEVVATPEKNIKLYPNPARNELTLEYSLSEGEKGYMEIVGLIGNKTIKYELNSENDRLEIPTAKLDAGIYLYKIIINNELVRADKLVIIK